MTRDVRRRSVHRLIERLWPPVRRRQAPSEAEGSIPSEPVSIAAQSLTGCRRRGCPSRSRRTAWARAPSCIAPLSAYMWLSSTSGYSPSCISCTTSRHSTPLSITLAFSIEQSRFDRALSQLEGRPRDAGDLALGVALRVHADALVALLVDAARLAEIDARGQLAHDHDVEPEQPSLS